jgi:TolB protein
MHTFFLTAFVAMTLSCTAQQPAQGLKKITGVVDSYPVLSPDGQKIVFESNRSGTSQVYLMDIDGGNLKQLTFHETRDNNCPVWSPDGKLIVFSSERDNDSEIYIMHADGSQQTRLTNQPGDDSHPHFSPDGNRIIFNSARATPDLGADWNRQVHEIFMMKVDGTGVQQVSRFGTISTYPSISPDGKKICFRKVIHEPGFNYDNSLNKRNSEVFVMNIDGTGAVNISNSTAYDGWPFWTADGKVIFSSNRNGVPRICQFYLADATGEKVEPVSNLRFSLLQGSLSQDGKTIYCQYNIEDENGLETGGIVSLALRP